MIETLHVVLSFFYDDGYHASFFFSFSFHVFFQYRRLEKVNNQNQMI